jgi:hypothetical protein
MLRRLAVLVLAVLLAVPAVGAVAATPSTTPPPGGGGSANGTLVLDASPATAKVQVNDTTVPIGSTGAATVPLPPGTYVVTVTASGYEPFSGNVTIVSGQDEYLTVHLLSTPPSSGTGGLKLPAFSVVLAATVVGIVLVAALGLYLWRRPRPSPGQAPARPPDAKAEEGPE